MENRAQVQEIYKYQRHLSRLKHKYVSLETAALLWIKKYAKEWRKEQSVSQRGFKGELLL
jgi:hypothetical protein